MAEKLKRRNKLIKIADSSEGGWETVRQYESNLVASDSEDEGKINRAENRAIKKRKSTKKSKSSADKSDHNVSAAAMPQQLFRGPSGLEAPSHFRSARERFEGQLQAQEGEGAQGLVTHADRSPIGEMNVHSTFPATSQAHRPKANLNDNVKDEYSLHSVLCNDISDEQLFTNDYFEYEQGAADILVKNRLKDHVNFWKQIGAYDFILDVIEHGYKLPFYSTPPSVYLPNNRSAMKHSDFVVQAIGDLLSRILIVECSERPFVVNPLTVSVQNSGKKRLILDLRHVNKHLWKTSVKFEDIKLPCCTSKKIIFVSNLISTQPIIMLTFLNIIPHF